uniref:Phosphoglycerate kinase n=1 Tax=Sus scrofa TaxID=9823 RepID=A0A8D1W8J4_PIG
KSCTKNKINRNFIKGKIILLHVPSQIPEIKFELCNGQENIHLISHLLKPNRVPVPNSFSLHIRAVEFYALLGKGVIKLMNCCGPKKQKPGNHEVAGSVPALAQLKFYIQPKGKSKDEVSPTQKANPLLRDAFKLNLSKQGDRYLGAIFTTSNRDEQSPVGKRLPQKTGTFLYKNEANSYARAIATPDRPYKQLSGGPQVHVQMVIRAMEKIKEMQIKTTLRFLYIKVLERIKLGEALFSEPADKRVSDLMAKINKNSVKDSLPVD